MMQDLMQDGKLNLNTLNRTVNVTLGKQMRPVKGGKKGHRASRDKMIVPVIRLFMNKEIMENIEKQIPNLPYSTSTGVVVRGGKRKSSRRRSTKRKSSRRKSSRRKSSKRKSSRRRSTRRKSSRRRSSVRNHRHHKIFNVLLNPASILKEATHSNHLPHVVKVIEKQISPKYVDGIINRNVILGGKRRRKSKRRTSKNKKYSKNNK